MKKNIIYDSVNNEIYPSIVTSYTTDEDGINTPQPKQVAFTITDIDGEESFVCMTVDVAIHLSDVLQRLAGQILVEQAREKSDLKTIAN